MNGSPESRRDQPGGGTFEQIVLPHLDAVYRIACGITGNPHEADDIVQETFVRAFRAFSQFELREHGPRPWLLRILHNVFYSARKRRNREPTLLDDVDFDHFADEINEDVSATGRSTDLDWEGFDEEIKQAVAELQPEYREVLLLWAIEGFSYKEMATICGCPMGTIMSRLYRARQLMGRKLQSFGGRRTRRGTASSEEV
ncbi:MAG: RNA polymerase sigma factor [Phycisphaerae bacterium]|nr:RNA polymerase sigma factor [Phycisphaerae bacterium]